MEEKQWEKRLRTVFAIYSALIWNEFNLVKITRDFRLDANQLKILEYTACHLPKMQQLFELKMQKNWTFSQLDLVEQAILLQSLAEKLVEKTDKKILIDQAVITTKKYCEADAYQFVNGILDKVL